MKYDFFAVRREALLFPVCACAVIFAAGCATEHDLPLPPGAYVADPGREQLAGPGVTPGEPMNIGAPIVPQEEEVVIPVLDLTPDAPPVLAPETETAAAPSVRTVKTAPAPETPKAPAAAPKRTAASSDIRYEVQKGDSLSRIAKKYKCGYRAIAEYNNLDVKAKIYPKQIILIPQALVNSKTPAGKKAAAETPVSDDKSVYIVKKGDSLSKIAYNNNVKLNALLQANGLDAKAIIYPGQKLRLPAGASPRVKVPVTQPPVKPVVSVKNTAVKETAKPKETVKTEEKKVTPVKQAVTETVKQQENADDILADVQNTPAAAPVVLAPADNVAEADAIDESMVITVNLDRDMTLAEAAKVYERSLPDVKKLNPQYREGETLKAGAPLKITIF